MLVEALFFFFFTLYFFIFGVYCVSLIDAIHNHIYDSDCHHKYITHM